MSQTTTHNGASWTYRHSLNGFYIDCPKLCSIPLWLPRPPIWWAGENWHRTAEPIRELFQKVYGYDFDHDYLGLVWTCEDQLPDEYPYDENYKQSKLQDGIRIFPGTRTNG